MLGVPLVDDDCVCVGGMKKSAMRRLKTVMDATPASLSSQEAYAEYIAPLEYPLPGATAVTLARRKHGAEPLPESRPNANANEYAVQLGCAAQHAARQSDSVVTSNTVPGADAGPTREPTRSASAKRRKEVELHDAEETC